RRLRRRSAFFGDGWFAIRGHPCAPIDMLIDTGTRHLTCDRGVRQSGAGVAALHRGGGPQSSL
ncbi:MAG TPA: hypothetical protein VGN26_18320, partial [Armatimonadota bacterium]